MHCTVHVCCIHTYNSWSTMNRSANLFDACTHIVIDRGINVRSKHALVLELLVFCVPAADLSMTHLNASGTHTKSWYALYSTVLPRAAL